MEVGNQIICTTEDNEEVVFYVEEYTVLNGITYLLVTEDNDSEETEAYILKDISTEDDEEAVYNIVEDEEEMFLIAKIFSELLDDVDISL